MSSNPYAPPKMVEDEVPQVPTTRAGLAALIRSFLDGEIKALDFDDRLDAFRSANDPVMEHVAYASWFHYDDFVDHYACLSKQEWDYFQRLLLMLDSDCTIEVTSRRIWSVRQLVAAVALCGFLYLAVQAGWGKHLSILAVPFGVISILLAYLHRHEDSAGDPYESIIYPFATLSDLETAYRSAVFRKTQYPKHRPAHRIRSPFMDKFHSLYLHVIWLIFSPIVLLFQAFPQNDSRTTARVVR
ncbi:hypothetical protein [Fuerstiella marisgermanici]|uniref:Uncharacterized protein n=1 Tax=Fuerstiella marisgermanici TaxID=1891926 RepID=A0A1P8WJE1_9PLAN|nr:hypothetical protein [Fuerstiella marisgermanici]APZ94147.1 hypothetical protein Fuma_03770 [Fuerstiella marisgermanici]